MKKLIIHRATGAWLIGVGFALFLIVLGVITLIRHNCGGLLYIFIGVILLFIAVTQLLNTTPQAIIDEEGVFVFGMGQKKIPWSAIRSVELRNTARRIPQLTLILRDYSQIPFLLINTNALPDQIYTEIVDNIQKHKVDDNDEQEDMIEEEDEPA